jgi:hypothetical protein
MIRLRSCAAAAVVFHVSVSFASAQSSVGLRDQMADLFTQSVVGATTPAGRGVAVHDPSFATNPLVTNVTELVNQISTQIGLQVATFPLGSSSGGFTYTYDSGLGAFTRSSDTFGPAFAERAVTAGRGKISFGMNYQHSNYKSLDGYDLEDGSIKFFLDHQPLTGTGAYVAGDEVQAALNLNLTSDTVALLTNFGVTDRFDIGVAVPIVHNSMDLTYDQTILDFSTRVSNPTVHVFTNGLKQQTVTSQGSASGIGDVVVRGKYSIFKQNSNGVAAAVDLTLPTGDEADMLGTGATQAKFYFIASGMAGDRLSPHVNVGYTAANNDLGNQFNYTGGVEVLASPRATILGDFVGRTYFDTRRLENTNITHPFQQSDTAPTETAVLNAVSVVSGNLTSILGTIGVKLNLTSSLLISAHLLAPFTDNGLKSSVTPVIGFDYTF